MELCADSMIYSTVSRAMAHALDIEWMAGTISRVPVQTSAKKRIKKVKKVCSMTTEAGEVISWKSWHFLVH